MEWTRTDSMRRFALAAAAAALCLLLAVGTAQARLSTAVRRSFTVAYAPASVTLLRPAEEGYADISSASWTSVTEGETARYELDFALSNADDRNVIATSDQNAALVLYATEGAGDSLTVRLTADGATYTAVSSPIPAGSYLARTRGPGRVYRFYNSAGEELFWPLPGGRSTAVPMTLTVEGGGVNTALLTLTARTLPD